MISDFADRPVFDMQVSDYRIGDSVRFTAFGRFLRYVGTVVNVGTEFVTCQAYESDLSPHISCTRHRVDTDNIQLI